MGGNIFKDAKRMTRDEYDSIRESLSEKLSTYTHLLFPESVRSKDSFGDVDVLSDNKNRGEVRLLMSEYQMSSNGPVDSYLYHGVQVDFIYVRQDDLMYAYNYFSWNDLGNLIGRIAHKIGLKHGHDGLWMILRDGTHVYDEICLTKNYKEAIHFLGFDATKFEKGFDTFDDMYQFVVDNARFSPAIFDLDNRNHIARVRDKKRKVYTGFLEWIEARKDTLKCYEWPTDKTVWMEDIFDYFPKGRKDYLESVACYLKKKQASAILNGERVIFLTGLQGKSVGAVLQNVKETLGDWVAYAIENGQEAVDEKIMVSYNLIFGGNK